MITLNYSPEGYTGAHVEMRVPDNSMTVNEVLDYIQRFLVAAGYVFDEGETIRSVRRNTDDTIAFDEDLIFGTAFGAAQPVTADFSFLGNDIISFG
jgi:hypothetical protein